MTDKKAAGIARAKAAGKYKGRKPVYTREDLSIVLKMHEMGAGIATIAKLRGLQRNVVLRIIEHPKEREEALKRWGL